MAKAKTKTVARLTKKQKRELELLTELQDKHGYMVLQLRQRADRFTMQWRRRGGTLHHTPAVTMRLAVPDESALGSQMKKLYLGQEKRA